MIIIIIYQSKIMIHTASSAIKKPKPKDKDSTERLVLIFLIGVCVVGVFLCVAMVPAYPDDLLTLVGLALVFTIGAFAAARNL